jgi:hypothetical protein
MLENWIATPIIWKEPAQVRKERFKRFPRFYLKMLIVQVPWILLLVLALCWLPSRKLTLNEALVFGALMTLFILIVMVLSSIFVHVVNCFEATYAVDEKGFQIQRAGINRSIKWRNVTQLEVIPCAGLDDIRIVRISTDPNQGTVPGLALLLEPTLWDYLTKRPKGYNEFPFEAESLKIADVVALHERYASPRKESYLTGLLSKFPFFQRFRKHR